MHTGVENPISSQLQSSVGESSISQSRIGFNGNPDFWVPTTTNLPNNSTRYLPSVPLPDSSSSFTHPYLPNFFNASFLPQNLTLNGSNSSIQPDRVVHLMSKWPIRFKGNEDDRMSARDFIYRVHALTMSNLGGNFELLCNNISVLFEGKAATWFWRHHAQVNGQVSWLALCQGLMEEFKDRRTDYDIRYLILNSKQKLNERFDVFWDRVSQLLYKLEVRLSDKEIIEILKRNARPELRQQFLFLPIQTVGQMRECARRYELLEEEVVKSSSRGAGVSKHLSELEAVGDDEAVAHIDALSRDTSSWKCFNCSEVGHSFRQCTKPKKVFCFRCGAPDVFTPQCTSCSSKEKNLSRPSANQPQKSQ